MEHAYKAAYKYLYKITAYVTEEFNNCANNLLFFSGKEDETCLKVVYRWIEERRYIRLICLLPNTPVQSRKYATASNHDVVEMSGRDRSRDELTVQWCSVAACKMNM